jgi:hypothetical protein
MTDDPRTTSELSAPIADMAARPLRHHHISINLSLISMEERYFVHNDLITVRNSSRDEVPKIMATAHKPMP